MTFLSNNSSPMDAPPGNWIIYDGDCPFCSNYMKLARLKETIGPVRLIDARKGGPEVAYVQAAGLDLNEGMAMQYQGILYHGPDCLHMMALLASDATMFNIATARLFRSPKVARALYPALRCGRNLALRLLGRRQIPTQ